MAKQGKYKIGWRLLVIFALLLLSNFLYTKFFFEDDLKKHSPFAERIQNLASEKVDVVYLGESSNISFRKDDKDRRKISEFIDEYVPKLKVESLTKKASHAGVYLCLLKAFPEKSDIKTLVVTMNLRSFGAAWIYSGLETALQKETVLLRPYPPLLNRLMLVLKDYEVKTPEEWSKLFLHHWKTDKLFVREGFPYRNTNDWDYGMFLKGIANKDGSFNQQLTELACHYIKSYAFQIDVAKNPRIKDFDAIVKLAEKRNWKVIFHILPENMERAQELVGSDLTKLMKENCALLIERYTKKGVQVVNNLELVENEQFIDQNWPTEHYAEKGRKATAKAVAEVLSKTK